MIVSILAWFAVATVINAVVDLDFDFYMVCKVQIVDCFLVWSHI